MSWLRSGENAQVKKDEKKIVLNVSSKEEAENESDEENEEIVDPYVDSMTNAEREAVKELRHRLRDLIQSEAIKRQKSMEVDDTVVVPQKEEEEKEEDEDEDATTIETHFREASEHMRTNKSLNLSNDQKGQVYGLYVQIFIYYCFLRVFNVIRHTHTGTSKRPKERLQVLVRVCLIPLDVRNGMHGNV